VNSKALSSRIRAKAAASPRIRKLAGKPPLGEVPPPGFGDNASAWKIGNESLWPIVDRYGDSFELPPISYGTVRDFADSTETMPGFAGANFDMKDMQRCWTVKAILGNVPRGGHLLEIGAGEPLVAGLLSRLGYKVTVVDPYDGKGNGPLEFQAFQRAYPDLRFIREDFPPREDLGGSFDAVYSISVLEHVPLEAIDGLIAGAQELLAERSGRSIHAVDHVLAGWGADSHLEKLRRIVAASGLSEGDLEKTITRLEADPETYFVSAEAHNRWRGDLDYDSYAMRRIVSVNLFAAP
jgi:methyltransferase family protein